MKIRPVGTALIYAERQTGGHGEANGRFSRVREIAQELVA
jgi:protease II